MIVPNAAPRSEVGRKQDDAWTRFAHRMWQSPLPFDEQWAEFRRIYSERAVTDGPPLVWQPTAEVRAASNIGTLMAELGLDDYRELHRWSVADRPAFWTRVLERLAIRFTVPPKTIVDLSRGPINPEWFPGAKLNCVDSCFTTDPERPAIVFAAEGGRTTRVVSYGELEALVNRVANGVRARRLQGRGVALYMPMTLECVAAYLGVIRAGGYVVSIADSFSPAELRKRVEIGNAFAIVTVDRYQRGGKEVRLFDKVREAAVPQAVIISADGERVTDMRPGDTMWEDFLGAENTFLEDGPAEPTDVINILFSSGTTGTPKAIPWTHVTPFKSAMDGYFHQDIHPDDTVAWPTNIGWMMGPWLIFATLVNGATMALFEGSPASEQFVRFVARERVSILGVIPALVRAWYQRDAVQNREWHGRRLFSSTGEASNQKDYLWLMSRTGYRTPVIEYLGGTEIGGGHITGTVVQPASPATFTTPALGTNVVLRTEDGRPAAPGEDGELFLIPPALGLSQRLLNQDHDAVYYQDCPPGPNGETLRRHGDHMAHLHGGFAKAQGRADDTMNLGGIKVSAREIEAVIDAHDAVYESAAIAVQPEGEGADRLVVYVSLRQATDPNALRSELSERVRQNLNPLFKIHDVVPVDALPRTASNKVMRRELRARYAADSRDRSRVR